MDFVSKYMDYAEPQTAAPRIYHYYMAYSILSQVIGNRATYHGFGGDKGPNFWFVLIGPSTLGYKSTILRIGRNLLYDLYGDNSFSYPSEGSHESFIERLTDQPQGMILSDEFVSIMNWFEKDYNGGMLALVTNLYDQPRSFERQVGTRDKKRTYIINNAFINMFSLSTIEWFSEKLSEKIIMGGFLPRFIVVKSDEVGKLLPRTPKPDNALKLDLVGYLQTLRDRTYGAMDYDDKALAEFDKWFYSFVPQKQKEYSHMMQPFLLRRISDLHKFAMIHSILRGDSGIINSEDLEKAIAIIENVLESTGLVINEQMTLTPHQANKRKILELIKRLKPLDPLGAPHSRVLKAAKLARRDFRDIVETLEEEGMVEIVRGGSTKKPVTFYLPLE